MTATSSTHPEHTVSPRPSDVQHETLRRVALDAGVPPPPVRPVDGECCERNCEPCVWYFYERALVRWAARHDMLSRVDAMLAATPPSTAQS